MPLTYVRAVSARVLSLVCAALVGAAGRMPLVAHLNPGGLMLFAVVLVVIFSTVAVALTAEMYLRRESILGLYAVIAALVAAVGAVVFAGMSGDG
jgi:hypothetical protein